GGAGGGRRVARHGSGAAAEAARIVGSGVAGSDGGGGVARPAPDVRRAWTGSDRGDAEAAIGPVGRRPLRPAVLEERRAGAVRSGWGAADLLRADREAR